MRSQPEPAGFSTLLGCSGGEIEVNSNLVKERIVFDDVGLEDTTRSGGLRRQIKVYRLPKDNFTDRSFKLEIGLDDARRHLVGQRLPRTVPGLSSSGLIP